MKSGKFLNSGMHIKFFASIIVSLLLISLLHGQQKMLSLKSGSRLMLEPDKKSDQIILSFLLDKTTNGNSIEEHVYREAFAQQVAKKLDVFGIIHKYSPQILNNHPYNWEEIHYITLQTNADLFRENFDNIITIITEFKNQMIKPIGLPNFTIIENFIFSERELRPDSLFQIRNYSYSGYQQYLNESFNDSLVQIYLYGDFDPLWVINALQDKIGNDNTEHKKNEMKKKFTNWPNSKDLEIFEHRLQIELKPINPINIVSRSFFIDRLQYFLNNENVISKKVFYKTPWNTVVHDSEMRFPSWWSDSSYVDSLVSSLKKCTKDNIQSWYYFSYLPGLNFKLTEKKTYVFYKQISWFYLSDAETILRTWPESQFPAAIIYHQYLDLTKQLSVNNDEM